MDIDFFSIDGLEEDIKKTLSQLNKMGKAFKSEACKKAVEEAAPILLEEEKQQLERAENLDLQIENSVKIKEIQKDVKFFKTLTVIWLILFVVGLCVLIFNPVLDIFNSALK